MGCTDGSRGRVRCLLFLPRGRRVASRLGGGSGRWAYGACHGDLRARPWRMWEAASLSSSGAAACTACHARCSSIAPLV